jgi:hypothetical protein
MAPVPPVLLVRRVYPLPGKKRWVLFRSEQTFSTYMKFVFEQVGGQVKPTSPCYQSLEPLGIVVIARPLQNSLDQ